MIRRLHQIHTALFNEETAAVPVTPVMYSVLSALDQLGPVDQTTLAEAVAIDKTNMADVLERLRKRGLAERSVAVRDKRVRLAQITQAGRAMLERLDASVARAHGRTIDVLSEPERTQFVAMMQRIVAAHASPHGAGDSASGEGSARVGRAVNGAAAAKGPDGESGAAAWEREGAV